MMTPTDPGPSQPAQISGVSVLDSCSTFRVSYIYKQSNCCLIPLKNVFVLIIN